MERVHVDLGRKMGLYSGRRRLSLAVLVGILAVLAGTVVPAQAQISVTTCPYKITAPGFYAINAVNAELPCPLGGIEITAGGVTLTLNNHIITGPGASTIGIDVHPLPGLPHLQNVVIKGPGLIRRFNNGIAITDCDNCQVTGVVAMKNGGNGMFAGLAPDSLERTGAIPRKVHVQSLTVTNNVFSNNESDGLAIENSFNGVFDSNIMSGNHETGLSLGEEFGDISTGDDLSTGNKVTNNTASGNGGSGMSFGRALQLGGNFSTVSGNITNGNGFYGIHVTLSSGSKFFNNHSACNGDFDLFDGNKDLKCGTDKWGPNTFYRRFPACIN